MRPAPTLFFAFHWLLAGVLGLGLSPGGQAQMRFRIQSLPSKYTPDRDTLFLAGNFNNWNPRDTLYRFRPTANGLEVRVAVPNPSLLCKVTRGNWGTVEVAANGLDIANRSYVYAPNGLEVLSVADWADTKGTHTSTAQVEVLGSQIWLPRLKRYRRIWVCKPANYAIDTTRRYPVMYFHDGQNLMDAATSFSGEWKVDEALQALENQANGLSLLAVGIDNGGSERISELTPFRHPTYGGGNAEAYAEDLAFTVKPLIDQLYRTRPEATYTGIGGSSLGGVASLYMAYRYPQVYSKALIFSPSLWFSDSLRLYCLQQPQPVLSRQYWSCGTNEGDPDMVPDLNQCYNGLVSAGMPSTQMSRRIVSGGTHSEGFWSAQVKSALEWLFGTPTAVKKKSLSEDLPPPVVEPGGLRFGNAYRQPGVEVALYAVSGRQIHPPGAVPEWLPLGSGLYFLQWQTATGQGTARIWVP
jgi:predicted alpha/beta superfamily hydrolase